MATNDEWITAGSGSGEMWDEATGPLVGKYIKKRSDVGPNNSMVYTLRKDDGSEVGIWGSIVIDTKFKEIDVGSLVRIEFVGKVSSKTAGRSPYKDYEIKYKPDPNAPAPAPADEMPPEDLSQPKSDDVVIQDLDANQNINLDDIPF